MLCKFQFTCLCFVKQNLHEIYSYIGTCKSTVKNDLHSSFSGLYFNDHVKNV